MVYCRDCGSEISARAEICPECGIRQQPPDGSQSDSNNDAGIAAAASFVIPGLGQVYNGELGKGILFFIMTVILIASVIGIILAIPLWLFNIYDAYSNAGGDDDEELSRDEAMAAADVQRANMAVVEALEWFESEHESTRTPQVRQRFQNVASISALTDDELNHILDAIDAYQDAVGTKPILEDARQAFVAELR